MSKDKKKPDTRPAAGAETSAEEAADLDAVMRKYDRESATRMWEGTPQLLIRILMAVFGVFCIGMTLFSKDMPEIRLTLFVGCIVIIGFLTYPANKHHVRVNYLPWYDIVLMVVGAFCFFYFALNAMTLVRLSTRIETVHVVIGVVGILILMELCRRCVGVPILCVAGAPTTAVTDLATTKDTYLVSLDDEHVAKLLETSDYYTKTVIAKDVYFGD